MVSNFPVLFGHLIHALTLGITVVVMAVPEGLPMMITVVLSSNMRRMLKDHVLVRKLVGIETSGNINVLFTDKTGTLTKGKLQVSHFITGSGNTLSGENISNFPGLYRLVELSCYYNCASNISGGHAIGGNATDRALLNFILPLSGSLPGNYQKRETIPFDSSRKFSASHIVGETDIFLLKGAPERILPLAARIMTKRERFSPLPATAVWRSFGRSGRRIPSVSSPWLPPPRPSPRTAPSPRSVWWGLCASAMRSARMPGTPSGRSGRPASMW